jgi:signal transduction histidine kinase
MPSPDDPAIHSPLDPFDQLRHDLKTPLTAIHGRAQLLARSVRRSPSLSDAERARLLEGLVAIEAAVRVMVTVIDAMGAEGVGDAPDSAG